jgi:hypothetical protein
VGRRRSDLGWDSVSRCGVWYAGPVSCTHPVGVVGSLRLRARPAGGDILTRRPHGRAMRPARFERAASLSHAVPHPSRTGVEMAGAFMRMHPGRGRTLGFRLDLIHGRPATGWFCSGQPIRPHLSGWGPAWGQPQRNTVAGLDGTRDIDIIPCLAVGAGSWDRANTLRRKRRCPVACAFKTPPLQPRRSREHQRAT